MVPLVLLAVVGQYAPPSLSPGASCCSSLVVQDASLQFDGTYTSNGDGTWSCASAIIYTSSSGSWAVATSYQSYYPEFVSSQGAPCPNQVASWFVRSGSSSSTYSYAPNQTTTVLCTGFDCEHAAEMDLTYVFNYDATIMVNTTRFADRTNGPQVPYPTCSSTSFSGRGPVEWVHLRNPSSSTNSISFSTCDSSSYNNVEQQTGFDTDLSLFTGSCGALTAVRCGVRLSERPPPSTLTPLSLVFPPPYFCRPPVDPPPSGTPTVSALLARDRW